MEPRISEEKKIVPSPDDSLTVGLTDYLTDLQCLMTHLLMHSLIDLICNWSMGHPALLKYGNNSHAEFENIRNNFNILSNLPATLIVANIQDTG